MDHDKFKSKIMSDVYYDLGGFNSAKEQLNDARLNDKSITMDDIKEWRKENIEETKQLKGYNSFVAEKPYEEFQMDLAFFDMDDDKYIGALVMIDIFTKFAAAIPFQTEKPEEILECIKEGIKTMDRKPKTFYTDNAGAFSASLAQQYFAYVFYRAK